MVVSMDHGDKADVHPTIKYPIGHRLALLALSGQYGYHSLEARSPELLSVSQEAQVLQLTFIGTSELRTSNAKELRGFEVITYDGKTHHSRLSGGCDSHTPASCYTPKERPRGVYATHGVLTRMLTSRALRASP